VEFYFNSTYTFGLFLFCIVIAGLTSFILYRKTKKDSPLTSFQIYLLSALRFVSVFLIVALFLELAIQRIKHEKLQPELIIGVDNSESVKQYSNNIKDVVTQLNSELKGLSPTVFLFDSQTNKANTDSLRFDGKRSDYSNFLNEINQNYLTSNIGAVLILGDGIFNAGTDPVYAANSIRYPIYTIGFGDTAIHTDAAIRKVTTNPTAYLETNFPIEIDLSFKKAAGKIVNLTVKNKNKTVYSRAIRIQSDDYFFTENISLKPIKEGIAKYAVRIDEVGGEENLANNTYDFSVNVISEKQKILLLAHGPHPDLGAITEALKAKNSYEFETLTSLSDDFDFTDYNLVIVHQLPDASQQSVTMLEKLKQSKRPFLFIFGRESSIARFNNLQTGLQIKPTNSFEQITPEVNDQFSLFRFNPNQMTDLKDLPPLLGPFGETTIEDSFETFADQLVQTVNLERPLIAFGKVEGQKRGFILGEGLWRWRIHSYLKDRSHNLFDEFILKAVNYLILRVNEDNFNLFYKNEYAEDEVITMQAELFNASFELVNFPDLEIEISDDAGRTYQAVFDKVDDEYRLNVGRLPSGSYSFNASIKLGETEYVEEGSFYVKKIQIELTDTKANFRSLNQIAEKTGGEFYLPEQIGELISSLESSNQLRTQKIETQVYQEFLSMKWLFFVILFLLVLEWFLRKYWGIY